MNKHSLLMRDSSEKDGKLETLLDYVLSWTLRRSEIKYSKEKPNLYQYCRAILGKLIEITMTDEVIINEVKTRKQHENIDLWVNVDLTINGKSEKHSILVENKAYSFPHTSRDEDGEYKNQLEVYKKKFDKECADNSKCHYVLITCHEEDEVLDSLKDICAKFNFTVFSVTDLQSNEADDTESDIFNEFWLRYW